MQFAQATSRQIWSWLCQKKPLKQQSAQIPTGRLGEPEEIARCVVFLASKDAGFINGSTISANGAQFFV